MPKETGKKSGSPAKGCLVLVLLFFAVVYALGSCLGTPSDPESSQTATADSSAHTLAHGELLEWNENDLDGKKVLVVKAKINPMLTNKHTIDQNYYNVADIIKKQNGNEFDEIQYWAVAEMTDGSDSKVISFTLDKETINAIADGSILDNQVGDHAKDLFVHNSLK